MFARIPAPKHQPPCLGEAPYKIIKNLSPLCVKKSQCCAKFPQHCDLFSQAHIFIFFLKTTTASMYITTAYASTTAICIGMAA